MSSSQVSVDLNEVRLRIMESELKTMISFYNQIVESIPNMKNQYDLEIAVLHLKHYEDEIEKRQECLRQAKKEKLKNNI